MYVKIIGLGWYGEPLAKELLSLGYKVSGTTRSQEKAEVLRNSGIQADVLKFPEVPSDLDADIVILNIPPFEEELNWFDSWNWNPKTWLIFISSTSVYPEPASKNGHILKAQEEWVQKRFTHWTVLRFGGLIGGSRHPGKSLSGKTNLSGRLHPVNLIHLDDLIGATIAVIQQKIKGKVIHAVSPEHPTREDYYGNHCRNQNLPLPEFDQNDQSTGKVVPHEELEKFYTIKRKL